MRFADNTMALGPRTRKTLTVQWFGPSDAGNADRAMFLSPRTLKNADSTMALGPRTWKTLTVQWFWTLGRGKRLQCNVFGASDPEHADSTMVFGPRTREEEGAGRRGFESHRKTPIAVFLKLPRVGGGWEGSTTGWF